MSATSMRFRECATRCSVNKTGFKSVICEPCSMVFQNSKFFIVLLPSRIRGPFPVFFQSGCLFRLSQTPASVFIFSFTFWSGSGFTFKLVQSFSFSKIHLNHPNKPKPKHWKNHSISPCQGSMALMGASRAFRGRAALARGLGSREGLRVGGRPLHYGLFHKIAFYSPVVARDPCPWLSFDSQTRIFI